MITLKTLPTSTAQEVFDTVYIHLLKQNQKSKSNNENSCMYRGSNSLKCAAGCIISDDEYSSDMEYVSWKSLAANGIVPSDHVDLILSLQDIHDSYKPSNWKSELSILATNLNLTIPSLTT